MTNSCFKYKSKILQLMLVLMKNKFIFMHFVNSNSNNASWAFTDSLKIALKTTLIHYALYHFFLIYLFIFLLLAYVIYSTTSKFESRVNFLRKFQFFNCANANRKLFRMVKNEIKIHTKKETEFRVLRMKKMNKLNLHLLLLLLLS